MTIAVDCETDKEQQPTANNRQQQQPTTVATLACSLQNLRFVGLSSCLIIVSRLILATRHVQHFHHHYFMCRIENPKGSCVPMFPSNLPFFL